MIDLRPKVLDYVKLRGPVLPVEVSKAINSNILFSSAVLSELVSNRDVFMSSAKIGGSSLYYAKGQEAKLQRLRDYLGEMPKKAYDLLKEKALLKDKALEPYQRVALRELKDFAVPINVKYNEQDILFWKWYLASDDAVNDLIRKDLGISTAKEDGTEKKKEESDERTEEEQEKKEDRKEKATRQKRNIKEQKEAISGSVLAYFKRNNISILGIEQIKKNKEIVYIINLPSQIGELAYLAYFKDKKKINEDDLILAHHKGQRCKLPVLFMSTGEITKPAEEYLSKELKGMVFKRI